METDGVFGMLLLGVPVAAWLAVELVPARVVPLQLRPHLLTVAGMVAGVLANQWLGLDETKAWALFLAVTSAGTVDGVVRGTPFVRLAKRGKDGEGGGD